MKSSRFQIILMVVFGSLFVAGVLIFALTTATGGKSPLGAIVIWGTLNDDQFNRIIRTEADVDNRLVSVSYQQKDADTFETGLTEALARGVGPDLFIIDQSYALRDAGKTAHISYERISAGQFGNTFVDASRPFLSGDGIIALPLLADPLILFWNRDLLGSAGYTVPPQYWDELPDIAKNMTKKSDDGRIVKSAIAIGTYDNIESAKDIVTTLLLQAGNPITDRTEDGHLIPAVSQAGAAAASVANAIAFYTQFADPSKDVYTWNGSFESARKAFANGDVGLYIGRASERPLITSMNPNLNFSVSQMLQYRNSTPTDTAHVFALAIPRTAKNVSNSFTVATILAGPRLSQELAQAYGMSSALKGVVSRSTTPSQQTGTLDDLLANSPKSLQALLDSSTAMSRNWEDPDPRQTGPVFRDMIERVVSGAESVTTSVTRLNASLKEIIGL